jgi:hypothetical protein
MSTAWTLAKCIGLLLLSLSLGVITSLCGMILVASVNDWDDAPGGGIFILLAFAVGAIAGLVCGTMCSASVWQHRQELGQEVRTTLRGLIATLIGVSLLPAAFFLPLTAPHGGFSIAVSAAGALVAWAALLIYQGAKTLALFDTVTTIQDVES